MVGTYLGEYALSYNPTRHGRPGLGASKGSAKWLVIPFININLIVFQNFIFSNINIFIKSQ